MIINTFYTYEEVANDLIIYTWEFQHVNNDGLQVYYNEQTNDTTECVGCDTEDEFARENDVFLLRLDVILEFENLTDFAALDFGDDFE